MEALPLSLDVDIEDTTADHVASHGIDLDDLAPDPVHSIPHLFAEIRASRDLDLFKRKVQALHAKETRTLILQIAVTPDPAMLWALHVTLDKRNIQPCLRWPANNSTEQMTFVTWASDLAWFQRRNPGHVPKSKSCKRLYKEAVGGGAWHETVYWMFMKTVGRRSLSLATSRALAMTLQQRQELMMCPTTAMVKKRRELDPSRFEERRQILYDLAIAHPDKSGTTTPEAVAVRRAQLWRVYVLSGKSPTLTAQNWELLTGEVISRQAISKQISAVKIALA